MNIEEACKARYTLIHDQEYLDWLEKFVDQNGHLDADSKWIREREEVLPEEDIKMIKRFSCFYKEICDYAEQIFVYPIMENFGRYYIIRRGTNYYRVGVIVDEIAYCFIEKVTNISKYDRVIDITDLSKIDYRAAEIEENLNDIINYIDAKRHYAEVPLKAILDKINKYVYSFNK